MRPVALVVAGVAGEPTVTVCWGTAAGAAVAAAGEDAGVEPALSDEPVPPAWPVVAAIRTGAGGGATATTSARARLSTPPAVVSDPTTHPNAIISRIATAADLAAGTRFSWSRGAAPGARRGWLLSGGGRQGTAALVELGDRQTDARRQRSAAVPAVQAIALIVRQRARARGAATGETAHDNPKVSPAGGGQL